MSGGREGPAISEEMEDLMDITIVSAKRNAKDSVFCHLFSKLEYLKQLYLALHPDDLSLTEEDFKTLTLQSHLTNELYNDLAFIAKDKVLILLEAQSTWSMNIIVRMVMYLAALWQKYIRHSRQSLYGTKVLSLPIPEFYVVYTGKRKEHPREITLRNDILDGIEAGIDLRVRVLYGDDEDNILNQYIMFCKIWDEQSGKVKYGKTLKAVEETIRICIENNVLKDYLIREREEVIDIMEKLWSQEQILLDYVESEKREAAAKAAEEARAEARAEAAKAAEEAAAEAEKEFKIAAQNLQFTSIKNLMETLHLSAKDAMVALKIPQAEQAFYAARL